MDEFEKEIKTGFLVEAKELLTSVEQCFLDLERRSGDPEILNTIFRLAHNLKGASGAVGFSDLADFTHKLESLLLALKDQRIPVSQSVVDLLLRSNDYLAKTIELLQENLEAVYANPGLASELERALTPSTSSESPVNLPPETLAFEPMSFSKSSSAAPAANKEENIRVSLMRIEKLLNNVGELSILQAVMTQQSLEKGTQISSLMRDTLSSMSKIIKETQTITMGLRMLPVKQTFQKMHRIVRDTSKSLGKEVELHISGEDTEIDKTVLEQLADPLLHIIRNAVDHGLEETEERELRGKSRAGRISLSASHQAGQILIEVRDDGRGLDADKLVAKAKAKGLIPADASLSHDQAHQLIFLPGFSTKEVVTDVSGRGVGMDVVKTNIAALQGHIEIISELGQGTSFRIFLPLTLAIIDSIVVRVENERFVIPLAQILEFFRPSKDDLNFVYGRSELVKLREETLSVFRLGSLIGRKSDEVTEACASTALIMSDGNYKFAVMVDQILTQQQVVIKSLGEEVRGRTGLMGSAILGDGKPALILDLIEITKSVRQSEQKKTQNNDKRKLEAA